MKPPTPPSGRSIRTPQGHTAFVPDPLPPTLEWTPVLTRALSDADRLIGQQRNRVYCATALLSILEAPAQVSPKL